MNMVFASFKKRWFGEKRGRGFRMMAFLRGTVEMGRGGETGIGTAKNFEIA